MVKTNDNLEDSTNIKVNVGKIIAYGILIIIAFIGIIVLFSSVYTVNAGERGIVLTWGSVSLVPISPGIHFKIPIAQDVIKMDVQTQKYEADLTAASKDLQDVNTKIAINYHLLEESTPVVYRDIGINYAEKLIYPLEQETNKATTAQFTAEELITKRETVRTLMESNLKDKLYSRGIVVESISIINFAFSPSFTQAIEQKVTAEQNALAEKNRLAQIEYLAQQRVAQAKGEAEAIKTQAEAIRSQGGQEYVQLQAINKWNGQMPQIVMGSGATPFVDITKVMQTTK